jgi:hypothetical protein
MSDSFSAKDELVRGRQLAVQTLSIPFVVTGNATPSAVNITCDEPAVLFLRTQGVDQITAALAANDTFPTYSTPNDATGVFNMLLIINETLVKVVDAKLVRRTPGTSGMEILAQAMANPPTGIVVTDVGDQDPDYPHDNKATYGKICLNGKTGESFAGANTLDTCLEVSYVTVE